MVLFSFITALFPTLCLIFVYINSSILAHSSCYFNYFLAICPLIMPITNLMLIRVDKVLKLTVSCIFGVQSLSIEKPRDKTKVVLIYIYSVLYSLEIRLRIEGDEGCCTAAAVCGRAGFFQHYLHR